MITCDKPEDTLKSFLPGGLTHPAGAQRETSFDVMTAKERLANIEEPLVDGPERALATGVLRQAAADLRRFRGAQDAIGREMYSDAQSWFFANDGEWPYSFTNVCRALCLSPEAIIDEVFADAEAGWYLYSRRLAGRVAKSVGDSFSNIFLARRDEALALAKS
ncbi:MAG: hypothetical protein H0X40_04740 [Chthoniobacterales bacterium]|nr:hypothetical protein [Chthoniobacterales bacterium]